MKKKIIVFLSLILITAISAFLIYWFSRSGRIKTPAVHAIPADAEFIVEIFNPFETGRKNLEYLFWDLTDSIPAVQSFKKDFFELDSLIRNNEKTQEFFREATLYISSHPYHDQTQWLFMCNIHSSIKSHFIDQFVVKANKEHSLDKVDTEYGVIKRIQIERGQRFLHYALKNNIWIASMHFEQVKSALQTIEEKNGYTAQPDFERLMKLQTENTGITVTASIKGLFDWASRIWDMEAVLPVVSQLSIPSHFTLQFDSLKIQAKGIQPVALTGQLEAELPELITEWKNESRFIPAESHTILSYQVSSNLFKKAESSWVQSLKGCAHSILFSDVSENHTWLVLPVEDEVPLVLNQLCDSVITDSSLANYPITWGNILQKEELKLLPFHNMNSSLNIAGIIENRLILAKTKESLLAYHKELSRQTMAERDEFIKSVQGDNNTKFSWLLWFKPMPAATLAQEETQPIHQASIIESVCVRWSNRKDLVRLSADVYFSEKRKSLIPTEWEVTLGGKITSDPLLIFDKDTSVLVQASDHILYSINARKGKVQWKRQMNESISSSIMAVNWSGNIIPQALFSCGTKVYMIDSEGKDVPGFPVDFNVPVSLISVETGVAIAKTSRNELWVINSQGKSSLFSSIPSEGTCYCGKPDGEFTCIWIGNSGAFTLFRNQKILAELPAWDQEISSKYFVIWNKTLSSSAVVFSDNVNRLVIRYLDKTKKPDIIQRNQPVILLNYSDFYQDGNKEFLVFENNLLKLINRNNEIILESASPFKTSLISVKAISGNYVLLHDRNKNKLTIVNISDLNELPGFPVYGNFGTVVSDINNKELKLIASDGLNKLLFYRIPF